MPWLIVDFHCPCCLKQDSADFDESAQPLDEFYWLCPICDRSFFGKIINGGFRILALDPNGETVEIIRVSRGTTGSPLVQIKPIGKDYFESGVNPYANSRELNYSFYTPPLPDDSLNEDKNYG
ncbi:MAG TPA: hypothetical protein ENI05_13285 [Porticoccus sp.]|nr:hypothetical protein [Porticoccus sp.]